MMTMTRAPQSKTKLVVRRFGHATTSVTLLALVAGGCGQAGDEESGDSTDVTTSALGESSCATVAATQTMHDGGFNYRSPTAYNTPGCFKAVIIDSFPISGVDFVNLFWADAIPTTQSACTNLWFGAYKYEDTDPEVGQWTVQDIESSRGVWFDGICTPPSLSFQGGWLNGGAYRVTASARTSPSGFTRSLFIGSGILR